MARFGQKAQRFFIRMVGCLGLLGMTSGATAQINEADRLARCENNRARMLEIQAAWPSGPAGWSDEQVSRARTAMRSLVSMDRQVERMTNPFLAREAGYDTAIPTELVLGIVRQMGELAFPFGVSCYPVGIGCSNILIAELDRKIAEARAGRSQRAALLQRFNVHRDNYIALNCVQGATARNSQTDLGFAMMTGTFESSFGTLTLSTGGGSYDYQGGQVRVTGISGNVMEGTWTQTRSGRQCPDGQYRGGFRFEFSATGFSGSFSYCDGEPGGAWNGRRRQ